MRFIRFMRRRGGLFEWRGGHASGLACRKRRRNPLARSLIVKVNFNL
jgi:hypothetical protein